MLLIIVMMMMMNHIGDISCDDFDDDAGETIGCVTEFTDWRTGWTDLDRHT